MQGLSQIIPSGSRDTAERETLDPSLRYWYLRAALSIMRKALAQTNTLGIGKIAFGGRELVAIGAPLDPKQKGLMLYMLRCEDNCAIRNSSFRV